MRYVRRNLDQVMEDQGLATYTVSVHLCALRAAREGGRALPQGAKSEAARLGTRLVDLMHEGGGWSYPRNPLVPRPDISNTSFGLRGLAAARSLGWRSGEDLPELRSTLSMVLSWRVAVGAGKGSVWPYSGPSASYASGSTTTAGLVSTILCRELVGDEEPTSGEAARAAIDGAMQWLATSFAPGANPRWHSAYAPPDDTSEEAIFAYSYLLGISEACLLLGRARLGEHDWYGAGAEYLVEAQQDDGGWLPAGAEDESRLQATSFALLFLCAPPGTTGRRSGREAETTPSR
jgi:hypothetical protein